MEITETIRHWLNFSIYDLSPDDVWAVFALVTLLYVGFLFVYFFRLALVSVPEGARTIVLAAAAFLGFILCYVVSQDWFRALIAANLAMIGAVVGLMLLGVSAFALGRTFAAGGRRSLAAVLPYALSLLYLFVHRSLIVTVLYLLVFAYQLWNAVPEMMAQLRQAGSSAGELQILYPGLVVLALAGVLLTPMVLTAYPALEIFLLALAFLAGMKQYDRQWSYLPPKRAARLTAYTLLAVLVLVAGVAYADDLVQLPSQVASLFAGDLVQLSIPFVD